MSYEERVLDWLKRELEVVPRPSRFTLFVTDAEKHEQKVQTFQPTEGQARDVALILVRDVFECAKNIAATMSTVATFNLVSFVRTPDPLKPGKHKHVRKAYIPFMERGTSRDMMRGELAHGVHESEPATPAGLTGQQMRHNEVLMRMLIDLTGTVTESHQRESERTMSLIAQYRKREDETREMQNNLLDRSAERQMQLMKVEGQEKRKDAFIADAQKVLVPKLGEYLPAVIEYFTGKKLPSSAPADTLQEMQTLLLAVEEGNRDRLIEILGNDKAGMMLLKKFGFGDQAQA